VPILQNRLALAAVVILATSSPALVRANPCEEEIAKAAIMLEWENRNIIAMELTVMTPTVMMLRNNYNQRLMIFLQMRARCEQAVREERQAAEGGPVATGCGKDTDCKGNRICIQGACVDP
jgi:hypothetical protein